MSIISGLLVIPMITSLDVVASSISVSNWLITVSLILLSSDVFIFASESSSSKIIIHGADAFAFQNISLIAFSDSPTHFDKISGPLTKIIFAPDSAANDLARSVFPHPGGP